ncbi:DUF2239 family protein [Microbulbifer taiwanensis]|uniref:DUF2239 family protein n=1 Tax=Microbulbifer taiwanensis TaxID=986746 RepID=A0ABW1YHE4_9GAMM|nr:DUF2239 family protein [Microbulbifer taiwanensis]
MTTEYVAIHDKQLLARGDLETIVRETKAIDVSIEPIVLALDSCRRIEFSWHGDVETVLGNLPEQGAAASKAAARKRGRPKLGVTAKEVTLLPRHWDWLASQRGGASVTLRRLVEQAIRNASPEERISELQNQLYGLMSIFADEPGFEEATRALYRNSRVSFAAAIQSWPEDIKVLIMEKFDVISQQHEGQGDA